jgi:hypothetical protein
VICTQDVCAAHAHGMIPTAGRLHIGYWSSTGAPRPYHKYYNIRHEPLITTKEQEGAKEGRSSRAGGGQGAGGAGGSERSSKEEQEVYMGYVYGEWIDATQTHDTHTKHNARPS